MTLHHTSSNEALYYRYGTSLKDEGRRKWQTIYHTKLHFEDYHSLYSQSTHANQNPLNSTGILNYPFRRNKKTPALKDEAPKFLASPSLFNWRPWTLIIIFKASPFQHFGFFLTFDAVRDLLILLGDIDHVIPSGHLHLPNELQEFRVAASINVSSRTGNQERPPEFPKKDKCSLAGMVSRKFTGLIALPRGDNAMQKFPAFRIIINNIRLLFPLSLFLFSDE
ncbi:hypothetical protein FOXG_17978 [Fusarium oxysporum f. sp. lycopersici 4287]|uniref:Uncharacterized protein n=2 Tax=Fusarium oxysporum TaxID=5507 RepID=A0A0J9U7W0_FUSO4|nr:hypothetical protein FOXG_17978 [Fusarium oxysporum f. sp. lycopersici 4287]EXK48960.1 hypothetical protein FOMG_01679 [Fusarium oxysporum f. sp. melonis 26406]KNA95263.1 hypothetical protein FOXG_17978 [Fusarium oxysporum f. sp. lycopersici 4287]